MSISFIIEFFKYFVASAIALTIDVLIYWFLSYLHIFSLAISGSISYLCGLVVAYLLLSYKVFNNGWLRNFRYYEWLLFLFSGLLGIAITYYSIDIYILNFNNNIFGAKIFAASSSFIVVYIFRKFFIFRKYPFNKQM